MSLAAAVVVAGMFLPAEPPPAPCPMLLSPVCSLVPSLPDLDHDVDLTRPQSDIPTDAPPAPPAG